MARIVQVAACALATFSNKSSSIEPLTSLMSTLTPLDIGLDSETLKGPIRNPFFSPFKPSAAFIGILADPIVTINAIILGSGQKIPLHNHPNMHGLIKCIHGKLKIDSFTPLPPTKEPIVVPREITRKLEGREFNNLVPCKAEKSIQVSSDSSDQICQVTPDMGNIHQVSAIDDRSAAFVDIISPPYTDELDCDYFEVIGSTYDAKLKQDVTWLIRLDNAPSSYRTVSIQYPGPQIDLS